MDSRQILILHAPFEVDMRSTVEGAKAGRTREDNNQMPNMLTRRTQIVKSPCLYSVGLATDMLQRK